MEMNIDSVCKKLLDNADVEIDLSYFPKVTFTFAVFGMVDEGYWEVIFVLNSVYDLKIDMEYDNTATSNDSYLVLDATVQKIEHEGQEAYSVYIGNGGGLDCSAKTIGFSWQANKFNRNEFKIKYSYMFVGGHA